MVIITLKKGVSGLSIVPNQETIPKVMSSIPINETLFIAYLK